MTPARSTAPVDGASAGLLRWPTCRCGSVTGVVLANELLDNLPFRLFERVAGARGGGVGGAWTAAELVEVLLPAPDDVTARLDRLAPDAGRGDRVPCRRRRGSGCAGPWRVVGRGRVLVIDYATDTTASLAARPVRRVAADLPGPRTGRPAAGGPGLPGHHRARSRSTSSPPTPCRPAHARPTGWWPTASTSWWSRAGRVWEERAGVGDLAAMRARSPMSEAAALTDPDGLGAFTVLEWEIS